MKKVLIITYYYLQHDIGSQRMCGLAKYLPFFGWDPIILTCDPFSAVESRAISVDSTVNKKLRRADPSVENEHTEHAVNFRTKIQQRVKLRCRSRSNIFLFLLDKFIKLNSSVLQKSRDNPRVWYGGAVQKGLEVIRNESIDMLISSYSPSVSHIVGCQIKAISKLPWVVDFRDLWTINQFYAYGGLRSFIDRSIERFIASFADVFVTVSQPLVNSLTSVYSSVPTYCIPNGFDPDLFNRPAGRVEDKFTIVYTGFLWKKRQSPIPLLDAVRMLISQHVIITDDIEVSFCVNTDSKNWLMNEIARRDLNSVVKCHSFIPREEVLLKQRQAQILFLITASSPNEIGIVTGKVFEYLAAQRPILAFGCRGNVVENLLSETGAGVYCSTKLELEEALSNYYREYKSQGIVNYHGKKENILNYSHREMARKFALLFDNLLKTYRH